MRGSPWSAVLATVLVAGCSDSGSVGEGTYPVELFLGVGARQSSLQMDECTSTQLSAYLRFDGDAPQIGDYTGRATMESSDPSIAFIGNGVTPSPDGVIYGFGQLVAITPGLATIRARYLDFTATIAIQVEELRDLRIEPALTDIAEDLPQKFDLIATFSEARPEQDVSDAATWRFEPGTARAFVDAGGEAQANSARDAAPVTLIAQLPECGRLASLSLRVSSIESLELEYEFPDEPRLPLGYSEALRVYARFANDASTRQNISRSAELDNVPDDFVSASVVTDTAPTDPSEILNPVDIGDDLVLVTALDEPGAAEFDVLVDSGSGLAIRTRTWSLVDTALDSLIVTPEDINLRYPDRYALQALGHFTNGMTRAVSREATWSSLDSTALAVSNQTDDAGTVESANVDRDVEVQAAIEVDGTIYDDHALIHVFSAGSSTPTTHP